MDEIAGFIGTVNDSGEVTSWESTTNGEAVLNAEACGTPVSYVGSPDELVNSLIAEDPTVNVIEKHSTCNGRRNVLSTHLPLDRAEGERCVFVRDSNTKELDAKMLAAGYLPSQMNSQFIVYERNEKRAKTRVKIAATATAKRPTITWDDFRRLYLKLRQAINDKHGDCLGYLNRGILNGDVENIHAIAVLVLAKEETEKVVKPYLELFRQKPAINRKKVTEKWPKLMEWLDGLLEPSERPQAAAASPAAPA